MPANLSVATPDATNWAAYGGSVPKLSKAMVARITSEKFWRHTDDPVMSKVSINVRNAAELDNLALASLTHRSAETACKASLSAFDIASAYFG